MSDRLPSASFDRHFNQVPRLRGVDFDPERCAALLTDSRIGLPPAYLGNIHIYVRPDYGYYPREERLAIRQADPAGYTDTVRVERLAEDGSFGQSGDTLITIAYNAGYSLGHLLRYAAFQTRESLRFNPLAELATMARLQLFQGWFDNAHEFVADLRTERGMRDKALKRLAKGVIQVVRGKKGAG